MTYLVINSHEADAHNVINAIYESELNQRQSKILLRDSYPWVSYMFLSEDEFNDEYRPWADEYEYCAFH